MIQRAFARCIAAMLSVAMVLAVAGCSPKAEAPGFTLGNLSGQGVSLEDFSGQPVVINFWQLSCPPCIEELPYFQAVHAAGNTGAVILTIAIRDSAAALESFMASNNYTFAVLRDANAAVAARYGIRFTPTTFFIDSRGRVAEIKTGAFTSAAELAQAIGKID
ncbi:TlpA disulfide reductase family protein [Dehalogenimonas sp. 4OHTPN]|uniref:TlpA disulfide reductase family protein n=1 Tax=Dehalogenimonas sp. 4OHTPN TaxID=3166643 RepID=A0AAU8G890_9CHLR